jgi:diketogulonate reductase-like aldo/keto reductase
MMRTLKLPAGEAVPVLGQGTWMMGERGGDRAREIAALRLGVELGMTLIDTAEMYGDGAAERLVGEALAGLRDRVFLVSKVYPHNASRRGVAEACERSLKRLGTDRIDLYLLHWRGGEPLAETVAGFRDLVGAGKIRHWGVSNFDLDDMVELPHGEDCQTNQVLYNLGRRGIEWDLLPWAQARAMPVMAYSPLEQARLLGKSALAAVARRHATSPAAVALAWVLARPGVIAIPKAGTTDHVRGNRAALDLVLDAEDLAALDAAFPPPRARRPLEML